MRMIVKKDWNTHRGLRRWFSIDWCREMCGDGFYYIGVTVFGLSVVALNVG